MSRPKSNSFFNSKRLGLYYLNNNEKISLKTRWEVKKSINSPIYRSVFKPECFITKRKRAFLTDFGLSRISLKTNYSLVPGLTKASW